VVAVVAVVTAGVVFVGGFSVFGAGALSLEMDFRRARMGLEGSWTSLPGWNMPRRSCQGGEDMLVVVVVAFDCWLSRPA
jgi:hypothetical protein